MKSMQSLKDLGRSELETKLAELKKEQFALQAKKSTGSLEKPAALKMMRKEIARVNTLIRQTELTKKTKSNAKLVGGEQ